MSEELPCPFCGVVPTRNHSRYVSCRTEACAMKGRLVYDNHWSRRAPRPPEGAIDEGAVESGSPRHVALWDAINAYADNYGHASSTTVARQKAVIGVERALAAIMKRNDP